MIRVGFTLGVFLMLSSMNLHSQDSAMGIAVNKLSQDGTVSSQQMQLLRKNLQYLLSGQGSSGFGSVFCDGTLSRIGEEEIAGIAKRKVVKYALDLNFYDVVLGKEYDVTTLALNGTGNSIPAAAKSALQQLRKHRAKLAKTLAKVGSEHQMAMQNCDLIRQKLEALRAEHQHVRILALTNAIAVTHPCYSTLSNLRQQAYSAQQQIACERAIQQAKASLAIDDFESASRLLGQVDPRMDCAEEVNTLIDEMGKTFSEKEMKTLEWYMKYKVEEAEIQKAQLSIISNIILKELVHAN